MAFAVIRNRADNFVVSSALQDGKIARKLDQARDLCKDLEFLVYLETRKIRVPEASAKRDLPFELVQAKLNSKGILQGPPAESWQELVRRTRIPALSAIHFVCAAFEELDEADAELQVNRLPELAEELGDLRWYIVAARGQLEQIHRWTFGLPPSQLSMHCPRACPSCLLGCKNCCLSDGGSGCAHCNRDGAHELARFVPLFPLGDISQPTPPQRAKTDQRAIMEAREEYSSLTDGRHPMKKRATFPNTPRRAELQCSTPGEDPFRARRSEETLGRHLRQGRVFRCLEDALVPKDPVHKYPDHILTVALTGGPCGGKSSPLPFLKGC